MPKKKAKSNGKKKSKKGGKKSEVATKPGDPFVKNEIPSPLKPGERVNMPPHGTVRISSGVLTDLYRIV